MKKTFMLFVLALLPMMADADAIEIDGIWYNLVTKLKQAEVTKNPSGEYKGKVDIPTSVVYNDIEYNVNCIGNSAFSGCRNLNSVTIPNSVTKIDAYAFYNCSGGVFGSGGLTTVNIPNSVISIGDHAFDGCSHLSSVTIPNNVTYFGQGAFSDCSALTSVTIPESVTSIGSKTFYRCSRLTSITIPNSVTSIGEEAFRECSRLVSITIGNNVSSIGVRAFYGCSGLTSVTIPESVKSIGTLAFYECSSLSSVFITDLEAWCNLTFNDTPFGSGHRLYLNDEEITDLVIPNTVSSIGNSAFVCCSGLTSVTIPNSVTSIGNSAFGGCSGLTSVTIPNSVTSIGNSAFGGCSGLTSITIPNNVTSIGGSTFSNCSGLTSITIPNNVTSIGSNAFDGCSGLTSATIGSGVKNIGAKAFASCSELTDVYCYAEKVPDTNSNIFYNSYIEYATLHVLLASFSEYKAKSPWSQFGSIVALDGDAPETPQCAQPIIAYKNGKLLCTCETEDVEYVYTITPKSSTGVSKDGTINLGTTFTVSVYATREGYSNSDTATAIIDMSTVGDVNGDGLISIADVTALVNLILGRN